MIARSLFFLLLLACVAAAAGQDAPVGRHPLTDLPPAGQLEVNYFFPKHPVTKNFIAGLPVTVVAGIHNDASHEYNISAIMGSINFPHDFSQHIQNFTQQLYFAGLPASQEISVEYTFRPDALLAGRDFQLALTLFYEDNKGGFFSTTFFNQTVDFTEVEKLIDHEVLFLYLLLAAAVAAAGFWAYKSIAGVAGIKTKSKPKPKVKSEAVKADEAEDWLTGTAYDPKRKAATAAKPAATKKAA